MRRKRDEDEYRRPLARRGEATDATRFSTDKDSLSGAINPGQSRAIGASGEPPAAPEGHDMTMRLHESAVNNYAATLPGARHGHRNPARRRHQIRRRDAEMDPRRLGCAARRNSTTRRPTVRNRSSRGRWTFRERPITVDFQDGKPDAHHARVVHPIGRPGFHELGYYGHVYAAAYRRAALFSSARATWSCCRATSAASSPAGKRPNGGTWKRKSTNALPVAAVFPTRLNSIRLSRKERRLTPDRWRSTNS